MGTVEEKVIPRLFYPNVNVIRLSEDYCSVTVVITAAEGVHLLFLSNFFIL